MKERILVTQSSMPSYEEYCKEIKNIWDTKWLTNNGEKHSLLEKKLEEYLNIENVTLFSNGHLALYTAIKAMNLTGEVITTPFTFASTTHAIVQNGLTPVFCDIREDDYTIDANKIEDLITEKTCAIVAVHVYGTVCDVEKIEEIAKKHNLKVIYDAAHAFGVEYKNKPVASFGDMSMFSFHATKVFNTIEGGAVAYKDFKMLKKLEQLKNFGIVDSEHVSMPGMNCKMNEFQAAMGLCNLKHIGTEIAKRKKVVEEYDKKLKNVKGIQILKKKKDIKYNYAYYPIVVLEDYKYSRDALYMLLSEKGIFSRKYFYPLTSDFECYKDKYNSNDTPIARDIASRVLTLPLYADLELEDVDRICDLIIKFGQE